MTDESLDILNDHYKDSFSHIRERETLRDRLFLVLIGLFGLLAFEIQFPANFGGVFGKLSVAGAELNLSNLPLPALLAASWVVTLATGLRYCQASITIERQYAYLHTLEDKISRDLGDEDIYRREGRSYEQNYLLFSEWAWFCYVILFPIIVVLATTVLIVVEWARLRYPWPYKLFDSCIALGVVTSFLLYRLPLIVKRIRKPFGVSKARNHATK